MKTIPPSLDDIMAAIEERDRGACKLCGGSGWQKIWEPVMMGWTTVPCRVCGSRTSYTSSTCQTPCAMHPDCVCASYSVLEARLRGIEERLAALEVSGEGERG